MRNHIGVPLTETSPDWHESHDSIMTSMGGSCPFALRADANAFQHDKIHKAPFLMGLEETNWDLKIPQLVEIIIRRPLGFGKDYRATLGKTEQVRKNFPHPKS